MKPLCHTLLLVTSLLVIPSLCGEALEDDATVTRVNSCCRVTFKWPTARKHVRCTCDELVLGAGDISAGAVTVLLSDIAKLTISENAFYHQPTLRHLHLRDIGHVTVESGGLRLPRNNAVKFSVIMENVGFLKLSPKAIDTHIKKISIKNVHMPECQGGTFDFKTAQVELVNVTIPEVRSRCFCFGEGGIRPGRGITLRSSTLGTVHREAIRGNIMDIRIESTMIRNITEQGIMAHVGSFYMGECEIGVLSAKGLSVSFKKTFKMKEVRINYMQKDALISVQGNPGGDQPTKVLLKMLKVGDAEKGSFAMHRLLPIEIQTVEVQEAAALRCPIDRRVLALMGLDGREELTSSETNVFNALFEDAKHWCDKNDDLGEPEKPDEEQTFTPEAPEETGFSLHRAGAVTVLLSDIAKLTISENAFYHQPTLRHLHLRDIGHVTVESGGLRLPRNNAVKFSVIMENVGFLKLSPKAIDTHIKKISIKNVHMPECQGGTFDFKTAQVELVNVTIPEVRSRCFCFGEGGIRPGRGITLRSSTLGTVHREAIRGNIMDIRIESTMIRNITEQGIMAHVGSFYMGECEIGVLSAKGLSVSFKKTFKMKEVRINYMKKDALIIVQRNPDGDQPTKVLLERLEVGYDENGSFAIHRLLPIDIQMVDVEEAAALPCPTYRRVLALTGLDGREELTSSETHVIHALYQDAKSLCDENDDLGEHEKPDEELTSTPEVSEDTGFFLLKIVVVAFWILMVVVGLAVVVGIAGLVFICFLCWHMQRSNKPTRETNEGKPLTGAAARG